MNEERREKRIGVPAVERKEKREVCGCVCSSDRKRTGKELVG